MAWQKLAQREMKEIFKGKTEEVEVHFVLTLEQRQFYKWLRLSGTFDQPNPDYDPSLPPLGEQDYPVPQRSVLKMMKWTVRRFWLDRPKNGQLWLDREVE